MRCILKDKNDYKSSLDSNLKAINDSLAKTSKAINGIVKINYDLMMQNITYSLESANRAMEPISKIAREMLKTQELFINSINSYMDGIQPIYSSLVKNIKILVGNPDSLLNWGNYCNKMSDFFWIFPYKMSVKELYKILQEAEDEKAFDKMMLKYFNKKTVEKLCNDISGMMDPKQKSFFKQVLSAYNNKLYALSNLGLITLIDNLLTYYLLDKGCTSRQNIFEPIIDDLESKDNDTTLPYIVVMVDSNINLLYETISFNEKISIKTNKKTRRNPSSHGRSYSNKKIDCIMLMNTIYYLLLLQNELSMYKDSLQRNKTKKCFYILSTKEKKKAKKGLKNAKK